MHREVLNTDRAVNGTHKKKTGIRLVLQIPQKHLAAATILPTKTYNDETSDS